MAQASRCHQGTASVHRPPREQKRVVELMGKQERDEAFNYQGGRAPDRDAAGAKCIRHEAALWTTDHGFRHEAPHCALR